MNPIKYINNLFDRLLEKFTNMELKKQIQIMVFTTIVIIFVAGLLSFYFLNKKTHMNHNLKYWEILWNKKENIIIPI